MSVKRYEVNGPSSVFEDENGGLVDYDDYAALEAKCAALAAEVQAVKDAVIARIKLHEEIRNAGRPPHTDFWHQSIYMADKKVEDSLSSTPNHDAFLAEMRASGVEMFARETERLEWHESTVRFVLKFAAQLRKGVPS